MADAKEYHNQFMAIAGVKKLQVLCAMLVLLHHLGEQDVKYLKIFTTLGFYPVAFFFFCSGYGLVKSWLSKPNYIENFWKKRMVKILYPYVIANVLYLIVKIALNDMDGLSSFKSFVYGGGVVKYSWYVIAIIYFYIAFYLCFRIYGKRSLKIALSGIAVATAVWMTVMIFMQFGEHRYVSSPCFILGCYIGQAGCPKQENIYSGGKEKVQKLLHQTGAKAMLCLLTSVLIISANITGTAEIRIICEILGCIGFAMALAGFSYYIPIQIPKVINILYDCNYEFYLYQGLWIIILQKVRNHELLFTCGVLTGTLVTAIIICKADCCVIQRIQGTRGTGRG